MDEESLRKEDTQNLLKDCEIIIIELIKKKPNILTSEIIDMIDEYGVHEILESLDRLKERGFIE